MADSFPAGTGALAHATVVIETRKLGVSTRSRPLLRNISLQIAGRQVFGLIGPSGAGKTTLLRCLNRLIELDGSLRLDGDILLHGESVFGPAVNPDALRARVGILFQQPVVFPVSIYKNVLFGARHLRRLTRPDSDALVERALRESALWEETRNRLHEPAIKLSVGQQQRLCLARTLALDPEVILMDEPTSSLDLRSAEAIEQQILRLRATRTVVLVTHNLAQAARVADRIACIVPRDGAGEVVACGPVGEILKDRERLNAADLFDELSR